MRSEVTAGLVHAEVLVARAFFWSVKIARHVPEKGGAFQFAALLEQRRQALSIEHFFCLSAREFQEGREIVESADDLSASGCSDFIFPVD